MKIANQYNRPGKWLRGSFHIHSNFSKCGWHSLEEVALAYRDYDFLAITDHDFLTKSEGYFENKTVFKGFEVSSPVSHMLLINPPDEIMENFNNEFTIENYQMLSDQCIKNGGISVLNHPNRYNGSYWEMDDILSLKGYTGIEIFSGDGIHVEEDTAFDKWDSLLTGGKRVWGFGNDDFHHWGQERRVWNVVLAEENNHDSILQSIKQGSFYVSTGYGFDSIITEENLIKINLKRNKLFDRMYKYVTIYGKCGRVLYEKTGRIDSVEYQCSGDEGYIRIAAYSEGGYSAFSQPIFIEK